MRGSPKPQPTDVFVTLSDADFLLGFNAAQTTFGDVAKLVDARTTVVE